MFEGLIAEIERRRNDPSPVLNRVVDTVMLPMLGRNYLASGLKIRTGRGYSAVTRRIYPGNIVVVRPDGVTVGVDYGVLHYMRWALEGNDPGGGIITPKIAKALKIPIFDSITGHGGIPGGFIFRRSVKAAKPHRVYYWEPGAELLAVAEVQMWMLGGK